MRHNPQHAVTDEAVVRQLIAANPWATIVSEHAGELVASHYPVLLITRFVRKVKMRQDKDEATRRSVLTQLRGDGPYA